MPPTVGATAPPADDGSAAFAAFEAAYPALIERRGKVEALWQGLSRAERDDVVTAAAGYARHRQAHPRKNPISAARFVGGEWRSYVGLGREAAKAALRVRSRIACGSPQWAAWDNWHRLLQQRGGIPDFRRVRIGGTEMADVPDLWPPLGREIDVQARWCEVVEGTAPYHRWMERLRELTSLAIGSARSVLADGRHRKTLLVPSEWPPPKGAAENAGAAPSAADEADWRDLGGAD